MSEVLHIVRKDVRRLRWILAIWVAVLAGRVVMTASAAAVAGDVTDTSLLFREVTGAFGMVEILLMALIVARLVHEEPLVGFNAFWITRPYSPRALALAKLLVATVVLAVLPLVADVVTMALFGVGAPALAKAAPSAAIGHVGSVLPLMALAVLTPALGAFVLAIVGIIAAVSIFFTVLATLSAFWADDGPSYTPPPVPDATPGLVMLAVFLCAALAVVVYQYRRRNRTRALALVVAGVVATMTIPTVWPWSFARAESAGPGAWASQASVIHDPSWGTEVVEAGRGRRGPLRRQVNARVTLAGIPGDVAIQSVGIQARLRFDDGTVIESGQMGGYVPRDRAPAVQAALGGPTMLMPIDPFSDRGAWSPMITLTEEEFTRHRGRTGRLDATIDFHLARTTPSGVLPLAPGAALERGDSRIEILGVERRTDSRGVALRQWSVRSPLDVRPFVQREYLLHHRGRGEALPGGREESFPLGGRGNAAMALLVLPFRFMGYGVSLGAGEGGNGFSASTQFLRFPGLGYGKPPPIDPAWFDGAELVLLDTTAIGSVTRQLTIENFVIPER